MNRKSGQIKPTDIEFRQGDTVIVYKNKALLSKNPGTGRVPQVIKGLWLRAEAHFGRADKRGITSGIADMWRDALHKHPQYFIAL